MTEIATYLKYANLQIAAESFIAPKTVSPGTTTFAELTETILEEGNARSSRFTATQAQAFLDEGWTVVEHISNTTTGFSGTLFRNSLTGEQVLSFRSTEFADDAARDNQATNVMEIKAEPFVRILFVHQNFPGQFPHLAPALAARGHEVVALRMAKVPERVRWRGVDVHGYQPKVGSTRGIHPWVADIETKTIRGEACWRKARQLESDGFSPDVIYAHPGWGESLFLKQLWPLAKLVLYGEFFYVPEGADMGFDLEFAQGDDTEQRCRLQMKNLNHLAQLSQADLVVSPTHWQASRFPSPWRERISVVHDGIDTDALRPDPSVKVRLADGTEFSRSDEVITFVARHLEPYRGFHIFMRALPALLKARPNAHILIVGEDGVSYGEAPKTHRHWREFMLAEMGSKIALEDERRVHFVGRLERDAFTRVLQLSTVHVYLTYPFVLSWSLLEAMSIGCAIVASDTAPVREAIHDGEQGVLVDFFDAQALVDAIEKMLQDNGLRHRLGVRIERVMTDNGTGYKKLFEAACQELGIRHIRTRPYTPKTKLRLFSQKTKT